MTYRVVIAVAALVAIQGVVMWIRHGREPGECLPLAMKLADMPVKLGEWEGKDEPMDSRVADAIGCTQVVNRSYHHEGVDRVSTQVASFAKTDEFEVPHPPEVCYTKAGWIVNLRKDLMLRAGDEPSRRANLLGFELEGQRILVVYWYQFGGTNVMDFEDLRQARWKMYGKKVWPQLIKVMMQMPAGKSTTDAEKNLTAFAENVLAWTKDIH